MNNPKLLPDFKNPPLDQMKLSAHFSAIQQLRHVDLGYIAKLFERDFPNITENAPLSKLSQLTQDDKVQVNFLNLPELTFLTETRDFGISFADDKFSIFWQKSADGADYPHFDEICKIFGKNFDVFQKFVQENYADPLQILNYHIGYYNIIGVEGFDEFFSYFDFIKRDKIVSDQFELQFTKHYADKKSNTFARLIHNFVSGFSTDKQKALLFGIAFYGSTENSDYTTMNTLLNFGRSKIANSFENITTKQAQNTWR